MRWVKCLQAGHAGHERDCCLNKDVCNIPGASRLCGTETKLWGVDTTMAEQLCECTVPTYVASQQPACMWYDCHASLSLFKKVLAAVYLASTFCCVTTRCSRPPEQVILAPCCEHLVGMTVEYTTCLDAAKQQSGSSSNSYSCLHMYTASASMLQRRQVLMHN
jgi:hypothetical protein